MLRLEPGFGPARNSRAPLPGKFAPYPGDKKGNPESLAFARQAQQYLGQPGLLIRALVPLGYSKKGAADHQNQGRSTHEVSRRFID